MELANSDTSPRALLNGEPLLELPRDLYIPPEALEVFLEKFSGPLDLLLYLIRKDNIDILDIPIAAITEQYLEYIQLMKAVKLELAADYLVMAAMLAEIKSRLLLPKIPDVLNTENEEADPRAELVRRLKIYEQMKIAAEELNSLPQLEKDFFWIAIDHENTQPSALPLKIDLKKLYSAMQEVLLRQKLRQHHTIKFEPISVRDRINSILDKLKKTESLEFIDCFNLSEGRPGIVTSFIAILELLKNGQIKLQQEEIFGRILVSNVIAA